MITDGMNRFPSNSDEEECRTIPSLHLYSSSGELNRYSDDDDDDDDDDGDDDDSNNSSSSSNETTNRNAIRTPSTPNNANKRFGKTTKKKKKRKTTTTTKSSNDYDNESVSNTRIGKKETKNILYLRLIVFIVLIVSCAIVATPVYIYTNTFESTKFNSQYEQNVHKVMESIGTIIDKTLGSLDAFSINIVSHANSTNQTWPYVTVSDFAIRASKTRSVSLGIFIETANIVEYNQRTEWEEYAWENKDWINETLLMEQTDENYHGPAICNTTADISIYGDYGPIPYNETRRFMPSWHMYPAVPVWDQVFNWDWLSDENLPEATLKLIDEHKAIITEPYMLFNLSDPAEVELKDILVGWFGYFIQPDEEPNEPMSDIMYPVVNVLDRVRIFDMDDEDTTRKLQNKNDNNTIKKNSNSSDVHSNSPKVVAGIRTPFYWRDVIKYVLPIGNNGLIVVFSNPCTMSFTYQIDGPDALYLGQGDLHDTKYNHMKSESLFYDLGSFSTEQTVYTGPPTDKNYCPMTITMYPSEAMQDQFLTNNPIIFTCLVVLIFAFTSIVFVLYDYKVEGRQKLVLKSVVKSNSILSSLLPSHIRDKLLFEEEEEKKPKSPLPSSTKGQSLHQRSKPSTITNTYERRNSNVGNNENYQITSFLDTEGKPSVCLDIFDEETDTLIIPEPMAEQYNETTILFASIAGFDTWSSNREAKHVFILLEVLFGSFDVLAKKKKVLNIEAIGDSYVAVSGIPDYQKGHAVIMSRFAECIIQKTIAVTQKLVVTLGRDTENLKLSVGLCSGPTCAGILRSAKSRFQLFGETIIVAQQLASTVKAGNIQCCQATADLLQTAGKTHWLTECTNGIDFSYRRAVTTFLVKPGKGSINASSTTGSKRAASIVSHISEDSFQSPSGLFLSTPKTVKRNSFPNNISSFPDLVKAPSMSDVTVPITNTASALDSTPIATKRNLSIRPEVTRPPISRSSSLACSLYEVTESGDHSSVSFLNYNESNNLVGRRRISGRHSSIGSCQTLESDKINKQMSDLYCDYSQNIASISAPEVAVLEYPVVKDENVAETKNEAKSNDDDVACSSLDRNRKPFVQRLCEYTSPKRKNRNLVSLQNSKNNNNNKYEHNNCGINLDATIKKNHQADDHLHRVHAKDDCCEEIGRLSKLDHPNHPKPFVQRLFQYSSPKRRNRQNLLMVPNIHNVVSDKNVVVDQGGTTTDQDEHTISFIMEESLRNWLFDEIKKDNNILETQQTHPV